MQLVLFDLDGTLTKSYHRSDNTFQRSMEELFPITPGFKYEEHCQHFTDSAVFDTVFHKFKGVRPSARDIKNMQEVYLAKLESKQRREAYFFNEVPGAKAFLYHLKSMDQIEVGISTGNWRCVSDFKLKLIDVHLRDFPFIGADDHFAKADFTRALIEHLQTQNEGKRYSKITYVGDSVYDYKMTQALGLDFVGISAMGYQHLHENGVTNIFENYLDQAAVLKAIHS